MIRDKVHSEGAFKFVFFDGYFYKDTAYYIEIRANPNTTGAEASRLDSFLVFPRSDVILWLNIVDDSWHSWPTFLKERRKPKFPVKLP